MAPRTDSPSSRDTPAARAGRLPGLEALRLIAAMCVLLLHLRANFGGARVFGRGYLGVDFFLMLSGFLMARTQEPRLATGLMPLRFMIARYKRLWPTMAAGGLIGLPHLWMMLRHNVTATIKAATLNFALLPNVPMAPFAFPLNIPAWTIFFELVMNSLHVTVLWRIRGNWIWLLSVALVPVVCWIGIHTGSLDVGARAGNFLMGGGRILLAYSIGIGLSRTWGSTPPLPVPPLPAIFAMPVVLALGWYVGVRGWWFDMAFVLVVCPLMIAGALRLRAFARTARIMGQIAFPLFALQMPIIEGTRWLGGNAWEASFLAILAGCAGAWISDWLARRRVAAVATAAPALAHSTS